MIALAPLLRSRATVGVAISAGVLLAVWANGAVKYRQGVHDGTTRERAAWSSEVALARNSATASQVAANAATSALRDSLEVKDRALLIAKQAAAMATGRYAQANEAYQALKAAKLASGDTTTTPLERSCEAAAQTCAATVATKAIEVARVEEKLRTAETLVARQDSVLRAEPARTTLTVREALAVQRAAFPKPNRVGWAALGGVIGASLAWVVVR